MTELYGQLYEQRSAREKGSQTAPVPHGLDFSVLVPGDWFFGVWRRGAIDPWLPEARAQANVAGNAAAATAGTFARSDCWVVYDGVVRPYEVSAFITAAGLAAARYVVILPSVTTCVERVASRGGHGFTSADATRGFLWKVALPHPNRRAKVCRGGREC
jgi:hypothetical protein